MVKNPNWQEADQLAIYKRALGVEIAATKKQLQLAERSDRDLNPRPPNFKSSALTTRSHCLPASLIFSLSLTKFVRMKNM